MYGEQQVIYMQSNLALLSGTGSKFKLGGGMCFQGNSWIQKGHPQILYGYYLTIYIYNILLNKKGILFKNPFQKAGWAHMPPMFLQIPLSGHLNLGPHQGVHLHCII